jgi:predicted enzyme related to lactoylglutathione lyase
MDSKPENQIDYVEFYAHDLELAKRFYSSAFGWKFVDYGDEYTSFSDGRISGGFTTRIPGAAHGLLVVIYCGDLDAAQERILGAGGKIVKETFSFPGGQRFHFADPNGNALAVWSDQ